MTPPPFEEVIYFTIPTKNVLSFSVKSDVKGLFDHRTNRRAHGTLGSNPRG